MSIVPPNEHKVCFMPCRREIVEAGQCSCHNRVANVSNSIKLHVIRSQQCSEHKPSKLGYLEWHDDAELRTKAGQKQKQCPNCSLWFWEDEY